MQLVKQLRNIAFHLRHQKLGGDDYNGKFIEFRVTCPNGEEQVIDPVVIPELPTVFNVSTPQTLSITVTTFSKLVGRGCVFPALSFDEQSTFNQFFSQANAVSVSVTGKLTYAAASSCPNSQRDEGSWFVTFTLADNSIVTSEISQFAVSPVDNESHSYKSIYVSSLSGSTDGSIYSQPTVPSQITDAATVFVSQPFPD
jgi:hypothetical protein